MSIQDKFKDSNQVYYLVECNFDGLIKRWAERDIAIDSDVFFDGKIMEISEVGEQFDISSFRMSTGSVTVTLANDDRLQDLEMYRVLDGSLCKVYIYCHGMTWAEVQADGLLFTGAFKKDFNCMTRFSFSIENITYKRLRVIPDAYITDTTFSAHRKEGGSGSVSGKLLPLIFGDFPKGIPLLCVDTAAFKYAVALGTVLSADADYTATTENVYDKDGNVIDAGNYALAGGATYGQPYTYFDFTGDQVDLESLSCSIRAIYDGGGEITGIAGGLIEHPAHIFQYLIKKYGIGISPDLESIGTMHNMLPYLRFAVYVNSPANAGDVCQRVLSQALCSLVVRNGKYGIMVFDPLMTTTAKMRKQTHHIGGSVQISKTSFENICNNLIINYSLNITTGSYEGQLVRNRTNNESCLLSYYQYGEQPAVILDLPDVNSLMVAEQIANRYLAIHSHRHDILNLSVAYGDGYDIEIGDAVLWTIPEGASHDGTGWHDEKCILVERTFTKTGINQKWWRAKFPLGYVGSVSTTGGYVRDTKGRIILDTGGIGIRDTRKREVSE